EFLNFAFSNSSHDAYTCWFFHGEHVTASTMNLTNTLTGPSSSNYQGKSSHNRKDSMEELLRDAFNMSDDDSQG
ncbi:hypothetical protein IHE45_10G024300, partial [Dioscorea alata]